MDIKEFKYAWRYTSENYALFSPKQLSEMNVVNENKAVEIWNSICDNEILQKSSYVQMMIDHKLTVFIGDCGWGDESMERVTQQKLMSLFEKSISDKVTLLYDHTSAISITASIFCEKWSDFCYPSDVLLIVNNNIVLLYYEDSPRMLFNSVVLPIPLAPISATFSPRSMDRFRGLDSGSS